MWLHNSNLVNNLVESQDPPKDWDSSFKQYPITVDYYHIRSPDSNTFTCYDLHKTIQHIIQTYMIDEQTIKPALQNLNNLNLIRTNNTPISSLKFQHICKERTPISKETFFKNYGVKYEN